MNLRNYPFDYFCQNFELTDDLIEIANRFFESGEMDADYIKTRNDKYYYFFYYYF